MLCLLCVSLKLKNNLIFFVSLFLPFSLGTVERKMNVKCKKVVTRSRVLAQMFDEHSQIRCAIETNAIHKLCSMCLRAERTHNTDTGQYAQPGRNTGFVSMEMEYYVWNEHFAMKFHLLIVRNWNADWFLLSAVCVWPTATATCIDAKCRHSREVCGRPFAMNV